MKNEAVAYLSVFVRKDGTWSQAGVYSEFPCEQQVGQGAWAMLAAFRAGSFHAASKLAMKHARQSYPWLKVRDDLMRPSLSV